MLIFCGKQVGAKLLSHLLERGDQIERVIAGSVNDTEVIELTKKSGIICDVYDRALCKRLVATGQHYDWLLSLWNPHVIPKALLDLAHRRLSLHPSLLPHARGSDSTAWTIRRGLPAGVSLIDITETLDGGGVYAQAAIQTPFPIRGADFHLCLQEEIVLLFQRSWPEIQRGQLRPVPQTSGGSFYWRKDTNADRKRDGNTVGSLEETIKWMLAHDFHPGTTAEMMHEGRRYRLRLLIEEIA